MVHETINGKAVSWKNEYGCGQTQASGDTKPHGGDAEPKPSNEPAPERKPYSPPKASGDDWTRVAYYDAEEQIADGITVLNNKGGQSSGVFS